MALVNVILAFVFGVLVGLYYESRKNTEEAIKDFCVNQNIRDENAILKKQVEQLQKSLNEHGII